MSSSKTLLWFTFALFLTVKGAKVEYSKIKETVTLDCGDADFNKEYEWKYNDARIIQMDKRGLPKKGKIALAQKAKLNGNKLTIPSLELSDSGKYSCIGWTQSNQPTIQEHQIYVVTASVSPSDTVLIYTDVTLKCEVGGGSTAQVQWIKPPGDKPYESPENTVTLSSVTPTEAGIWTCQVKDNGGSVVKKMEVGITVVGPLKSSNNISVAAGDNAELTCFLSCLGNLRIVGGGWSRHPPNNRNFPTLTNQGSSGLTWLKDSSSKTIEFKNEKLSTNFTVKLKNVKSADAGLYVCKLEFEGNKHLTTELNLKVEGVSKAVSERSGSSNGIARWVWITVAAGGVLLIALVASIVLIHRRNRRMRRKITKLKSMRQPLKTRNYCQCDRPHPSGRKDRPPPLPRHQYDYL
ncbi:junctional adhesion molecule-like [Hoplias malabaricus]|uniref:junctional adhesion molecule-like n=1 Tax=Hoplias malabaricus TaxID=27720 RepID=UPI0034636112